MSSPYKTPESQPLEQPQKKKTAFDTAQRYTSLFLKIGLILIPSGIAVGFIFKAHQNWYSDILASLLIGIGILCFTLSIFSIIPMILWGLIQGFTEAKKKK